MRNELTNIAWPIVIRLPARVYYVEAGKDDSVMIALETVMERAALGANHATTLEWYDTAHERMFSVMRYKHDRDTGNWTFWRDDGRIYRFMPMSLEIYDEKVKRRLPEGADFENLRELEQAFMETIKDGD